MEGLVAAGQAVNDLDADAVGFAGITTSIADAFLEASMFVTGQGVDWVDDEGYNLDDPELIAAVDAYLDAVLSEAPQGLGEHERNELLFNGRAAMMFDGNVFWQQIQDFAQEGVKENIGIALAPFPNQPGSVTTACTCPPTSTRRPVRLSATSSRPPRARSSKRPTERRFRLPPPRDGAISDALRDRFPEESTSTIQAKAEAEFVCPGPRRRMLENYGVFSSLTADAMIELMVTDRPTEEVLSDLQTAARSGDTAQLTSLG